MFSADVHIELLFIRILYRVNCPSEILWVNNVFPFPKATRAPQTMGPCRFIIIVNQTPITRRYCLGYDYVPFRLHCFNPPVSYFAKSAISPKSHTWSEIPAAIAGVIRRLL